MKDHAYNAAVVFCYLIRDDQILLIRRANPPAKLDYTVVGGKKEPGGGPRFRMQAGGF